jgi:hypothetical protein
LAPDAYDQIPQIINGLTAEIVAQDLKVLLRRRAQDLED